MFDDFDPTINPDGSRNIFLSRGYVAVVDAEDYEEMSKYRWFAKFGGLTGSREPYAARSVKFKTAGKWTARTIRMHRQLMDAKRGEHVDHLDGNTLNNRKSNLEVTSPGENSRRRWERENKEVCVVPF
jgi:hypothetical protein